MLRTGYRRRVRVYPITGRPATMCHPPRSKAPGHLSPGSEKSSQGELVFQKENYAVRFGPIASNCAFCSSLSVA